MANNFRVPDNRSAARMPEYQRQNFATPGADVSARLSDAAAGIYERGADQTGRQLMALGGAVQQSAKVGNELYVDYQTSKAKEAWLTYKQEAAKKQAELAILQGKNALGESGVEAQLRQWQQAARENLSKNLGGMATKLFDNAAAQTDAGLDSWAVGKVHAEALRYENKTSEAHISLLQDEALANANDPAELAKRMSGIKGELKAIAGRSGLDETWINAEFKSDQQKILTKAIADRIEGEQMGEAASLIRTYGSELGGTAETLKARFRAKGRELEARARAAQERARTQAAINGVQEMVRDTAGMEPKERDTAVMERLSQVDDMQLRSRMYSLAKEEISFQETRRKAADTSSAQKLYDQGRAAGETPLQFLDRVNSADASEQAKKLAVAQFNGELNGELKENKLNMRALGELRAEIDEGERNGSPMNQEQIYAFAYNHRMTVAQTKDALKYLQEGGNLGGLKQSAVNQAWLDLQADKGKSKKAKNVPSWLYGAVKQMLPSGKDVNSTELRRLVARALMEGSLRGRWFSGTTYGEALTEGTADIFEAEVD